MGVPPTRCCTCWLLRRKPKSTSPCPTSTGVAPRALPVEVARPLQISHRRRAPCRRHHGHSGRAGPREPAASRGGYTPAAPWARRWQDIMNRTSRPRCSSSTRWRRATCAARKPLWPEHLLRRTRHRSRKRLHPFACTCLFAGWRSGRAVRQPSETAAS